VAEPIALAEVATVTQRLAVLLAAGVAPSSAWEHVGESSAVASEVARGTDLPEVVADLPVLERDAWLGLAAAWSVAAQSGAPLAPSLRDYARALRSLVQGERDARVALAGPVATARLVLALPPISVLFGMALGFNTLGTLFTTVPGWICLAVGTTLMLLARRWNRRLLAAAGSRDPAPGLACDLMAIAMNGGVSLDRARDMVAAACERFGIRPDAAVEEVLELSRRAGVPAAELLRSEADELRRASRAAAQERSATLAVKLMLPLGLCILPAFMVLGVFPLLVTVVSSTVGSF